MAGSHYPQSNALATSSKPRTEFEILKEKHRFLRDDEEDVSNLSWDDKLAHKYYSNLWKEFAVCDLKHYKSGNFALRWRTEDEVLSGAGEETCGNTRCAYHQPTSSYQNPGGPPPLQTLELPFGYVEQGESKSALVKVVLCERCVKKLLWKKEKERGDTKEKSESKERRHRERRDREKPRDEKESGSRSRRRDRSTSRHRSRDRSASPRRKK